MMTKAIKAAESWAESLPKTIHSLENFIAGTDDLTACDVGILYDLLARLRHKLEDKTSLLAKLKREEEIL